MAVGILSFDILVYVFLGRRPILGGGSLFSSKYYYLLRPPTAPTAKKMRDHYFSEALLFFEVPTVLIAKNTEAILFEVQLFALNYPRF